MANDKPTTVTLSHEQFSRLIYLCKPLSQLHLALSSIYPHDTEDVAFRIERVEVAPVVEHEKSYEEIETEIAAINGQQDDLDP